MIGSERITPMTGDETKFEKQYIGMAGRSVEEKVSYQPTLRAVGKYLDERSSCRLNVLELPDGYLVRYQGSDEAPDQIAVNFSWAQLLGQGEMLEERRTKEDRRLFSSARNDSAPSRPGEGYENFLRALGYELDRSQAYTITLDEVDDGMVLTYLFIDARQSFLPHKRMVFLTPKELDTVKQDALDRRAPPDVQPRKQGSRLLR
jgi:hypothetical protein